MCVCVCVCVKVQYLLDNEAAGLDLVFAEEELGEGGRLIRTVPLMPGGEQAREGGGGIVGGREGGREEEEGRH